MSNSLWTLSYYCRGYYADGFGATSLIALMANLKAWSRRREDGAGTRCVKPILLLGLPGLAEIYPDGLCKHHAWPTHGISESFTQIILRSAMYERRRELPTVKRTRPGG